MRIFRDLDLVEHLGSGVPRILRSYGKECFKFTENFLRMIFPVSEVVAPQVIPQIGTKSGSSLTYSKSLRYLARCKKSNAQNGTKFKNKFITPFLNDGLLEMTIPDKPNSSLQKYRLTEKGEQLKKTL